MESHGEIKCSWFNDTLYIEAYGPFNLEGVKLATDEYLYQISQQGRKKYCVIEVWDEESLGGPDVMKEVSNMWRRNIGQNCLAIAIVVSNAIQKSICENLLPISKGRVFLTQPEAELWIKRIKSHL